MRPVAFHHPSTVRRAFALGMVLWVVMVASSVGAQREDPRDVVVIVNRKNATSVVTNDFVQRAFLKQVTRWEDDETIRPVDLFPKSAVRKRFSERFLGRSVEAVKNFWQQRVFSGRDIPPPEFETERAVIDYVKQHPGAIGYVSGDMDTADVKVLNIR